MRASSVLLLLSLAIVAAQEGRMATDNLGDAFQTLFSKSIQQIENAVSSGLTKKLMERFVRCLLLMPENPLPTNCPLDTRKYRKHLQFVRKNNRCNKDIQQITGQNCARKLQLFLSAVNNNFPDLYSQLFYSFDIPSNWLYGTHNFLLLRASPTEFKCSFAQCGLASTSDCSSDSTIIWIKVRRQENTTFTLLRLQTNQT